MNALTTTNTAIASVNTAVAAHVTRAPIKSLRKLIVAIREQWASTEEIESFHRQVGDKLDAEMIAVVQRAYARARYREGYDLTAHNIAHMCGIPAHRVLNHAKFLGFKDTMIFTNNQASRIMCRLSED